VTTPISNDQAGSEASDDKGEVLRLRHQVANRERVIGELNQRIQDLESAESRVDPVLDNEPVAEFHERMYEMDAELRNERQSRRALEVEVARQRDLLAQLESLRAVRLTHTSGRIRRAVLRLKPR